MIEIATLRLSLLAYTVISTSLL